jgi:hypothetical protein
LERIKCEVGNQKSGVFCEKVAVKNASVKVYASVEAVQCGEFGT